MPYLKDQSPKAQNKQASLSDKNGDPSHKNKKYVVGIDLGTTNIVVSYCELAEDSEIQEFAIPQLVAPGQIESLPMLPAIRYHFDAELDEAAAQLPWGIDKINADLPKAVIGKFAQQLGNKTPSRLVSSAKSWLGFRGEANAEIHLPENSGEGVETCTPLEASAGFLSYIAAAWDMQFPDAKLKDQAVIITVPASFDDIARALTIEAIKRAGIKQFNLLEEPQAACYYWVAEHDVEQLRHHQHLMVCDVGGGTTDFTLIKIGKFSENAKVPELERIAVGDHLMLGGDNMDLALAARVLQKMELEPTQRTMNQLLVQCQQAKEVLLSENAPEQYPIQLHTGGSSLFASTKETRLTQKEVQQALLDGFFPLVNAQSKPKTRKRSLSDMSLPYPADAAISRHIAAFLDAEQHALNQNTSMSDEESPPGLVIPDVWLLNGGPFLSSQIQQRLQALITQWSGTEQQTEATEETDNAVTWLTNPTPQGAVARGATLFGRALELNQQLIKSAVVRHYFLKAKSAEGDKAICVLPKHTELNSKQKLQQTFTLTKGQKVQFDIGYSLAEKDHSLGDSQGWNENLHQLPGLATQITGSGEVEVNIESQLDELGVLNVSLLEIATGDTHQLNFNLRNDEDTLDSSQLHHKIYGAIALLDAWFGPAGKQPPKEPLRKSLEKLLGKRDTWSGADARFMFDHLMSLSNRRRRSETHERNWFNIAGFCLRPGIGYAGDKQRIDAVWELYGQGIQYVQSAEIWAQWWAFWRRASAGLSREQQLVLYTDSNHVLPANKRKKGGKTKVIAAIGEKLRLIGALERLPVDIKIDILKTVTSQLSDKKVNQDMAWCAARLINRKMAYADATQVLPPENIMPAVESALSIDWKNNPNFPLLAVSGAKLSSNTANSLDETLRHKVKDKLPSSSALQAVLKGDVDNAQDKSLWGDELPAGLSI